MSSIEKQMLDRITADIFFINKSGDKNLWKILRSSFVTRINDLSFCASDMEKIQCDFLNKYIDAMDSKYLNDHIGIMDS